MSAYGGFSRTLLVAGASVPVLVALVWGAPALADTTVGGGSQAVATATAASGAPDNIVQTGTLTVSSGPAITLNSDNSVTNSGTIQVQDASNVTGILALGGHTGTITSSGAITLNETAATTTTDSAGNVTGPFAAGGGRFGIRLQGASPLAGDVTNSGTITIQGNNSAAISLEGPLAGALVESGAVAVSGADSFGIRGAGAITGGVTLSGAIAASGPNAQAVSLGGDVGGGLVITSTVTATGYHSTARSTTTSVLADQNLNDIARGGPAIAVAGSLGQGLLVTAPPAVVSSVVTDANGDGVADATEATGAVTAYGSAPAIQVGAMGRDISLGDVGVGDSAYGVVIGGTVSGQGVRDGVSATGLQLGLPGGGAVTLSHGIRIVGSLTAVTFGADATALHLYGGAMAPVLSNAGTLQATMTGEGATNAHAVVIETGGALPVIFNSGTIKAVTEGATGEAVAILDRAGSLTHLENAGSIVAQTLPATGTTETPTGATIAIDDAANSTGFSLLSYRGAGSTVDPTIEGDILMGSGDDQINVQAGTLTGALSFGAGDNSLTLDGGASVMGAVTAEGGRLAISIGSGSLQIMNANRLDLTGLNLGAASTLVFTVDGAAGRATELDVAGAATIADGAKIGLRMSSLQSGAATYTLIRASQLTAGALDQSLLGSVPYLYATQFAVDPAAGTLSVQLSQKTATELGLSPSIAGAYAPLLAAIGNDATLSGALLAQTTRGGFMSAYEQLLPEHSGGIFQMVSAGVEAFGRPLDDRQAGGGGGAWGQEVNFVVRQQNEGDLSGYNSWGVGLVGGYELPATRAGIFGVSFGGLSGELRPHRAASVTDAVANLLELGGYWRTRLGPFAVNARAAGDYLMAKSHRAADIRVDGVNAVGDGGTATGHWNGWGLTSRVRVSYEARWKDLYLRPQVGLDYLQLREGGYQESGGGVLDLAVDRRKTAQLSGFAGVAAGAVFGDDNSFWGPEVLLGYRDVVSRTDGNTTARFVSGGDAFTVGPAALADQGFVARLALKSESGPAAFSLEVGGEKRDGLTDVDAKIAAHVSF